MIFIVVLAEIRQVKYQKVGRYAIRPYTVNQTEMTIINQFPRTDTWVFHDPNNQASHVAIPLLNKILKYTDQVFNITSVEVVKDKKDANGMNAKYQVTEFPTIIMFNGDDKCRIDPNEDRSWESDLIRCLQQLYNLKND